MEGALFDCPAAWRAMLPPGVRPMETAEALTGRVWDLLALTPRGCGRLKGISLLCRILLVPGECPPELLARLGAESVVTYGLSHRDSLTLSSLAEPVLCVQRALPRTDGALVEPQEFPLPGLPWPAEGSLPLLGLRLLQMPLTEALVLW